MFKIILTQTDCSPKQLCTTEMQHVQGINFMPQKIPNPQLLAAPPMMKITTYLDVRFVSHKWVVLKSN